MTVCYHTRRTNCIERIFQVEIFEKCITSNNRNPSYINNATPLDDFADSTPVARGELSPPFLGDKVQIVVEGFENC